MADSKDVESGKAAAVLSYLVIGILWFFADEKMKKNSFVKFHVKQSLVLIIAAILYNIILGILFSMLFNPFALSGGLGIFWILRLLYYVPYVFGIIGILNAVNGSEKELPIIGKWATKFTF